MGQPWPFLPTRKYRWDTETGHQHREWTSNCLSDQISRWQLSNLQRYLLVDTLTGKFTKQDHNFLLKLGYSMQDPGRHLATSINQSILIFVTVVSIDIIIIRTSETKRYPAQFSIDDPVVTSWTCPVRFLWPVSTNLSLSPQWHVYIISPNMTGFDR